MEETIKIFIIKHSSICKARRLESSLHNCSCHSETFCTSNSVYLRKPVVRHFLCTSAFFCCYYCCCCCWGVCSDLSFLGQHCRLKQTFLRNVLPPSSELSWIQLQAEVIRVGMCCGYRPKCSLQEMWSKKTTTSTQTTKLETSFYPEQLGRRSDRNVGKYVSDCTASHPNRHNSSQKDVFFVE